MMLASLLTLILSLSPPLAHGADAPSDRYVMHTTDLDYEEVSLLLQSGLQEAGYSVRFVQPVDVGLRNRGIEVGVYRVVLFEPEQADATLPPEAAALLPWRITIDREGEHLRLSALRPSTFAQDPIMATMADRLGQWEADIEEVLSTLP